MTVISSPVRLQGWVRTALAPAGIAAVASLAYPFVWGPFALALTLLAIAVLACIAGIGTVVSYFWIRPRIAVRSSTSQAQSRTVVILAAMALVITLGCVAMIVLGSRTPDGEPQVQLLAPVALALGVSLVVYVLALLLVVRRTLKPSELVGREQAT